MKYAFLIYANEADSDMSDATMQRWWAFDGAAREQGVLVAGEGLHPIAAAQTVRTRGSQHQITDGPFAETKEQFGGFYVLDLPDLDAAIEWAKKIPAVEYGSIEIRPVVEFEGR